MWSLFKKRKLEQERKRKEWDERSAKREAMIQQKQNELMDDMQSVGKPGDRFTLADIEFTISHFGWYRGTNPAVPKMIALYKNNNGELNHVEFYHEYVPLLQRSKYSDDY